MLHILLIIGLIALLFPILGGILIFAGVMSKAAVESIYEDRWAYVIGIPLLIVVVAIAR